MVSSFITGRVKLVSLLGSSQKGARFPGLRTFISVRANMSIASMAELSHQLATDTHGPSMQASFCRILAFPRDIFTFLEKNWPFSRMDRNSEGCCEKNIVSLPGTDKTI